jgi:hypothetical protein
LERVQTQLKTALTVIRTASQTYDKLLAVIQAQQCPPKPRAIQPNRFTPRALPIDYIEYGASIVGGFTNFGGNGSLAFRDMISDETASVGQPLSESAATFGLLGSISVPSPFGARPADRLFFETGFLGYAGNRRTGSFDTFSPNLATGMTTASQNWSVPLMFGYSTPLSSFGVAAPNVSLQFAAGGIIDHRTLGLSLFEVLPTLQTSASVTTTQVNPALDFGVRYQVHGSSFSVGARALLDFQRPVSLTARSEPFPSAIYTLNTGSQVTSTFLIDLHYDSTQQGAQVSMSIH